MPRCWLLTAFWLLLAGASCESAFAPLGNDGGAVTPDGSAAQVDGHVGSQDAPASSDGGSLDAMAPADAAASQCTAPLDTSRISLPADDSMHDESAEWWYWTGHLRTADGRWFGFEQAVFRKVVLGVGGMAAHSALTDIEGNTFYHAVYQPLLDVPKTDNGLVFEQAGQRVSCGDGHDTLHGLGLGFSFDLQLETAKRPTLQHEDGYTDYSFGGYTYYYSRERMAATGSLVVGTESFAVTGTAWFDHQYGELMTAIGYGWDWFGIQLDDNREIMLFTVHAGGTPVVVGATLSDADCVTTELAPEDFEVESLGTWTSPHTFCTYPSGWHVRVKDLVFDIQPTVADQELFTSAFLTPIYWEGPATVTGSATGRAYVELSGYCPPLP